MERRKALADFLRQRRAGIEPHRLGFTRGPRRRTPGLRREEVAERAGVSVDWYVRLEQGRDVTPSRPILEAIAEVLGLDEDERAHLFLLARDEGVPRRRRGVETIDPSLASALAMLEGPAAILGRRYDLLAWNPGAVGLFGVDPAALAVAERNMLRLFFIDGRLRARYVDPERVGRDLVASARHAWGRPGSDLDFDALIDDLAAASPHFRALWALHEVRAKASGVKVFVGDAGPQPMAWHALVGTRDPDQRLVFFVAAAPA